MDTAELLVSLRETIPPSVLQSRARGASGKAKVVTSVGTGGARPGSAAMKNSGAGGITMNSSFQSGIKGYPNSVSSGLFRYFLNVQVLYLAHRFL